MSGHFDHSKSKLDHKLNRDLKSATDMIQEELSKDFELDNLKEFLKVAKKKISDLDRPIDLVSEEKKLFSNFELLDETLKKLYSDIDKVTQLIKEERSRMEGYMITKQRQLNNDLESLNKQNCDQSKKLADEITVEVKLLESNMQIASELFVRKLQLILETLDADERNILRDNLPNTHVKANN